MNAKIEKLSREIEEVEKRIATLQEKSKEMKHKKMELENLEIIGMIRRAKIPTENLSEVLEAYRNKGDMPFSMEKEETYAEG